MLTKRKVFSSAILEIYRKVLRHRSPSPPPANETKEVQFQQFSSPTTYFTAKFKAPSLKDEDYPALSLATQILDNRLFEEVRTKRGLTYAVHCSMGNSAVNSGYLYVTSTQLPEAVRVMMDEVKKIQTELIDAKSIELQIRKFTSAWWLGREQSSSQAHILSLYQTIGTGWQNSNSFIERLNKVTPEQIRAVSQKYFKDFTYGVVGPQKAELSLPGLPVSPTVTPTLTPTPSRKVNGKVKAVKKAAPVKKKAKAAQ